MKSFVYILQDDKQKFYIDSTNNLKRRLKAHLSGHTQTTSRMTNPVLVFVQEYKTLDYARKIERKLKKFKRRDYIEKIVKDGYIKASLS